MLGQVRVATALLLLAGCASSGKVDLVKVQADALESTASVKAPSPAVAKKAVERFHDFFAVFDEDNVRKKTKALYAEDAFFNDTLKTVRGAADIEEYLVASANATESCKVQHLDTVSKDGEYYFRWRMDILFKRFKKGQVQSSYGISHVRFNPEGKIIYHQDYWDSGSHFFEKLPVVGGLVRWVKGRL